MLIFRFVVVLTRQRSQASRSISAVSLKHSQHQHQLYNPQQAKLHSLTIFQTLQVPLKVSLLAIRQPGISYFLKERPNTSWVHPLMSSCSLQKLVLQYLSVLQMKILLGRNRFRCLVCFNFGLGFYFCKRLLRAIQKVSSRISHIFSLA